MVHVNGKKVGGNDAVTKFTAYVSPYFVVSNGGAYTKHIYAASQRIASKLGNEDGFGADPRRVEQAGGKKISDIQKDNIGARFSELGFTYSAPEKEKVEKDSTMDSEAEEKLIFFYHPDHLGSTSYVTDADGNIAQHVEYIPYGEVFVEERNNSFSTNYLFNAKELDNETGLYYYGARYLDPTGAMWLSVDPMWEKNIDANPYNYCHGNPITMVDPDGRNDYEIDDEGHIKFLNPTDSDKDVIYHYVRNRHGEIKERYTKSFTLDKGYLDVVEESSENKEVNVEEFTVRGTTNKGTEVNFDFNSYSEEDANKIKENAKKFFEFVADVSDVEWSFAEYEDNILVSSSHDWDRERLGAAKAQYYASQLKHHIHSHPNIPLDYGSPRNISRLDISFKNALIKRGYKGQTQAYAVKYKEYINYEDMSQPLLNQK